MKKLRYCIIILILVIILFLANTFRNILLISNIKKLENESLKEINDYIVSITAVEDYDELEENQIENIEDDYIESQYIDDKENTDNIIDTENEIIKEDVVDIEKFDSNESEENIKDEEIEELSDGEEILDIESNEFTINDEKIDTKILMLPEKIPFKTFVFTIIKSDDYFYQLKIYDNIIYVNKSTGFVQKSESMKTHKIVTYIIEE